MEFFRGVNIDWMGKAKYFVALSLTLLAIGAISIIRQGGLRYGIDFRGGTLVYVRFAGPPPLDQLRKALAAAGLTNSTLQQISGEIGNANASHDVVIGLEQKGQGDAESLDAGKTGDYRRAAKNVRPARHQARLQFANAGRADKFPDAERSAQSRHHGRRSLYETCASSRRLARQRARRHRHQSSTISKMFRA